MTDDELLLFHYRDGLSPAERDRIEAQLRQDQVLAQRYQELVAELAVFPAPAPVRVPDSARRRWAAHLDQLAARDARSAPGPRFGLRWQLAGAFTLLLLGFVVGMRMGNLQPPNRHIQIETLAAADHSPLVRAVQAHLDLTGTRLGQLSSVDLNERRSLLAEIITQNRLYERSAQHQNADKLARVLRAMEPVLVSLANESEDPDAFAASLRQLEFELTVMQTKLAQAPSNALRRS